MNLNQQDAPKDKDNCSPSTYLSEGQTFPEQSQKKQIQDQGQIGSSIERTEEQMATFKESDSELHQLQGLKESHLLKQEIIDTTLTKNDGAEVMVTPKTRSVASKDDENGQVGLKCVCGSGDRHDNEDLEHDWQTYEDDSNQLPLTTIVKIGNMKKKGDFYSSQSQTSQPKTKKSSKNPDRKVYLGQSFFSEESEQSHRPMNCNHCSLLRESNCKIKAENCDYVYQINSLRQQCSELRISKKQAQCRAQVSSDCDEHKSDTNVFSEKLMKKMIKLHRHIIKMRQAGFQEVVSFAPDQDVIIPELITDLKFLMSYIGKKDKAELQEKNVVTKLHENYKKIIEYMKKYYEQKLTKADSDLKTFMNTLVQYEKKRVLIELSNQEKEELNNRNLKKKVKSLYISTEDYKQDEQLETLREKVQVLSKDLKDEKKKAKTFENSYKHLFQKYSKQIVQLGKQKSLLLMTVKRYELQFEVFMQKITQNSSLTTNPSKKLFTNISQRVFQISNCIPFQDNDEQNLFAADNQQELYDMIQRIRRFAFKIEDYRNQKDLNEHNIKTNITTLFKNLILVDKIPLDTILEAVKSHQQLNLDYLKDYLLCVREKLHKAEKAIQSDKNIKPLKFKKSFSLEKIQNFKYGKGNQN